jgi:hypothetical protein
VAGGAVDNSFTFFNTLWKYHITTDQWTQLQNLPFGPSQSGGAFALNGKGFFLTSRDSANNSNCDTTFWEYDPLNDTWQRRANFPDAGRQNSISFTSNGKGYVGENSNCTQDDNHFWKYDPRLDQWTQVASPNSSIISSSGVSVFNSSEVYTYAGWTHGSNANDVWRYNIATNNWDSIGQVPGHLTSFPVFWSFDSISLGGGGLELDSMNNQFLGNNFYKYNYRTNLWTPVIFINSFDSIAGGTSFVFNGKGYQFGGIDMTVPNLTSSNKLWSFDASKYIHDTTTGIVSIKDEPIFSVYPNPSHSTAFSISTSESGDVIFSDALGRVIDERRLKQGVNQIRLTTDDEVVFYHATLQYGATANGKVVFLR